MVAQVRSLPARASSLLGESTSGGGSAAPPHSGGLAAARVVGRTSRGAVGGLVALGGLAGQLERPLERSLGARCSRSPAASGRWCGPANES